MADLDLDALTRLAEAATPGPWTMTTQGGIESVHYRGPGEDVNSVAQTRKPGDWEYIATVSPDVVLALVARVREAEVVISEVKEYLDEGKGAWAPDLYEIINRYEKEATQ